ncbi:MAG TPA: helix-turn-helix transcriptional regulator [Nitrospira sp.]|nr:helix-turn-helix transcriptional regulator [Nitrospira sp.]
MPASTVSPEAGRFLKAARLRVRLSMREVQRLSLKIAEGKKSRDYYVSHTWLTDIEKGEFTPSIYKLYSLSIIYKCSYDEMLQSFGIRLGDIAQEQTLLTLPRTHLIGERGGDASASIHLPADLKEKMPLVQTNLVSRMFHRWGGIPVSLLPHLNVRQAVYGYVGTQDFTLFPLIRPGSFVEIDAGQKHIDRIAWSSEFDRPIFFIELRDSYVCSWCELREGRLLLVPSPQSRSKVREVRFPSDADIIGRVVAVSMCIAEIR